MFADVPDNYGYFFHCWLWQWKWFK